MQVMVFLICSLVTYRVTRFVLEDTMFEGTRNQILFWLGGKPKSYGIDVSTGLPVFQQPLWRRKLVDLLTCPFCFSMYPAAVATIVADYYYSIPLPAFYWPAVAAGALAAWRYIEQN